VVKDKDELENAWVLSDSVVRSESFKYSFICRVES